MNDLIKQYNGAKKGRRDSRLVSTPLPFKPKINKKDFSRGYIVRHFVQKVNDDFQNRKNKAGWSFVHGYSDIEYGKNDLLKYKRAL